MDTRRRFCCCGGHPCKEALHKLHRADDCARERRALNNSLVTASDTRTADHFDILGQRPRARVDAPARQSHKLEKRWQCCYNVVGNLGCGQPVYAREERIARVMRDRGGAAANRAARHQPLCRALQNIIQYKRHEASSGRRRLCTAVGLKSAHRLAVSDDAEHRQLRHKKSVAAVIKSKRTSNGEQADRNAAANAP